jgi:hypothetical protein
MSDMSKGLDKKREDKKKPAKTLEEKRAAKTATTDARGRSAAPVKDGGRYRPPFKALVTRSGDKWQSSDREVGWGKPTAPSPYQIHSLTVLYERIGNRHILRL